MKKISLCAVCSGNIQCLQCGLGYVSANMWTVPYTIKPKRRES